MLKVLLAGVFGVLVAAAPAWAQNTFPPKTVSNLQVLPASSTPGEVIGAMRDVTRALGVRCQYCHVGTEGQPLDQFDFVSDSPARKQTARAMMRLVNSINAQIAGPTAGAAAPSRVTCYTCHRGAERPVHAPDPPKPGPAERQR
jgi:photosynthetic reaction center cytochrome c subunit